MFYNKAHFNESLIFLDDLFLNPILHSGGVTEKEQCCNERRSDAKIV